MHFFEGINEQGAPELFLVWTPHRRGVSSFANTAPILCRVPYDGDSPSDAIILLSRMFLTEWRQTEVNGTTILAPRDTRVGAEFADVAIMAGRQLRHCKVSPYELVAPRIPPHPKQMELLAAEILRHVSAEMGLVNAVEYARATRVNINSENAIRKTYGWFAHDLKPLRDTAPPGLIKQGFRRMMRILQLLNPDGSLNQIPCTRLSMTRVLQRMTVADSKSSGYTNTSWTDAAGKVKTRGKKKDAVAFAIATLSDVDAKVRKAFDEEHTKEKQAEKARGVVAKFGVIPTIIWLKAELRKLGEDPEKARAFLIKSIRHYVVSKAVFEPLLEYLKARFPLAGGKRAYSGAGAAAYEYLKLDSDPSKYKAFSADAPKKDQHFEATEIGLLGNIAKYIYKELNPEDYHVIESLIDWCNHESSHHILTWAEGFRAMIGKLGSGDFRTGHLNGVHGVHMMGCFLIKTGREFGVEELLRAEDNKICRYLIDGDNWLMTVHIDYIKYINWDTFSEFVSTHFQQKPMRECVGPVDLLAIPNDSGFIDNGRNVSLAQRFMVEDPESGVVMWYRCTSGPLSKLIFSAQGYPGPADGPTNLMRLADKYRGLCQDTWGANRTVFNLCYLCLVHIRRFYNNDAEFDTSLVGCGFWTAERAKRSGVDHLDEQAAFSLSLDFNAMRSRQIGDVLDPIDLYYIKTSYADRPLQRNQYMEPPPRSSK